MLSFRFNNVCIESYAADLPPHEITSEEIEGRLAPLYEKLKVPFGTLEKLSGIRARRCYDPDDSPSQVGTRAVRAALAGIGFDQSKIQAIFNCSVCRDFFEPATAVVIHNNLGLPEDAMAMDITNACVGFSNGLLMLSNMIELGVVQAGIIVSGEVLGPITETTIQRLLADDNISRSEFLGMLATFTLGSGATAMVLCHRDIATSGHRVIGSVARSASQHKDLCLGNSDFCFHLNRELLNPLMETESRKLIGSAAKHGNRAWNDASAALGWSADDVDRIFCHQVGRQAGEDFYRTMGLPIEKEYTVYQRFGNLVSAALPLALILGANDGVLASGDKVLLTGFGSGLNAIFTGLEW